MLPVQPRCFHLQFISTTDSYCSDEELRSVGIRPGVRHGQHARTLMLQLKVLVRETLAVDGLAAHSISFCDVTSLDHEMRNDAMKHRSLVPEWLSALPNSLLSCAQVQEVVYCLWHYTTIPTSHE